MSDNIKKSRRVPKLRFPGFTDDWEQRKLGEITSSYSGGTPSVANKNYYDGGSIPFIKSGEIGRKTTECFITNEGLKNSSATMVNVGDILYALYGATSGEVERSQIRGAINQAILAIVPNDNFDSEFLVQWLKLRKDNIVNRYLQGGQGNLSASIVKRLSVKIPMFNEQKKIGEFFKKLDDLITFQQRKLEHLQLQKKALLQKMFPKDGTNVPELRFPGFTDAWEQRKLGEVGDYSKGNGYSKSDLLADGNPVILYGRLYTNYQFIIGDVDTFATPKECAIFSKGNEVIVPASGETAEDIARASAIEKPGILLGGDLNIIRPFDIINHLFLALALSHGQPKKDLAKRAQGKSVVHIHNSDIQEIDINYPSKNEQEYIVGFFREFDSLITFQQRKLEHLKLQKKALLQQMFV